MTSIVDKLITLLGAQEDSEFFHTKQFGAPQLDKASETEDFGYIRVCDFTNLGIRLACTQIQETKKWSRLEVHVDSDDTKSGYFKTFHGKLMAGVDATDTKTIVRQKLKNEPRIPRRVYDSTKGNPIDTLEVYDFPPLEFVFAFDKVTDHLQNLTISYLDPYEIKSIYFA